VARKRFAGDEVRAQHAESLGVVNRDLTGAVEVPFLAQSFGFEAEQSVHPPQLFEDCMVYSISRREPDRCNTWAHRGVRALVGGAAGRREEGGLRPPRPHAPLAC
jgi:hypothetical protein